LTARRDLSERFWSWVDVRGPDDCWEWMGFRHKGYGRFTLEKGRADESHRVAFRLTRGPIPTGLDIDHLCRNRACQNPAHMEPVTRAENLRRGLPYRVPPTVCKRGHEFSEQNTYQWHSHRHCRSCKRERSAMRVAA
jgi:hypothetical protein